MDYRDQMDIGRLKLEPGIQDLIVRALNPREPVEAKIGQDGQFTVDMFKKEKPKGEGGQQPGQKPTQQTTTPNSPSSASNQVGFRPALSALAGPVGGPSAADLAGLTPEQIMAVVGQGNQARQLEQKTISQLIELPHIQAQVSKLLRPEEQWVTLPPDASGRSFQVSTTTGERKPAVGATPLTMDQRLKIKETPSDIPRGDYWKNPTTKDTKWVDFPSNPPSGYTQRVPKSTERVISDLPERKQAKMVADKAANARYSIRAASTNEQRKANKALIPTANDGSQEPSIFVWDPKVGLFNVGGAIELSLPEGLVGDNFTPAMVSAIGEGRTIKVKHPQLGVIRLQRKGKEVVIIK